MSLIQEGTGNIPPQPFVQWNDPKGSKLVAINRDGTIFCQGVGFQAGGGLLAGPVPIIQTGEDLVNSLAPTSLSFELPLTTLYQVTFYYGPSSAAGSGTWTPTVSWTDPSLNALSITAPYLGVATAGNVNNYQSYSIPFFCDGGTAIVVAGAYSGAPFDMNISIRVVAMP